MTPENRNLILAVALSMAVLFGWQILVIQPELEKEQAQQALIAGTAGGNCQDTECRWHASNCQHR
jgi:YidC/Oxa1 family membrane protein insertase